jgi:hypothetical protein
MKKPGKVKPPKQRSAEAKLSWDINQEFKRIEENANERCHRIEEKLSGSDRPRPLRGLRHSENGLLRHEKRQSHDTIGIYNRLLCVTHGIDLTASSASIPGADITQVFLGHWQEAECLKESAVIRRQRR